MAGLSYCRNKVHDFFRTSWKPTNCLSHNSSLPPIGRNTTCDYFRAWQAAPPPSLHAILVVLLRGLGTAETAGNAAQALRNLCARCGDALSEPQTLQGVCVQVMMCLKLAYSTVKMTQSVRERGISRFRWTKKLAEASGNAAQGLEILFVCVWMCVCVCRRSIHLVWTTDALG